MIDKEKLLKELGEEFEKIKVELGLDMTLDELDDVFYVKDYILSGGYVPIALSERIRKRMSDCLFNWLNFLHNIIMPNPNSLVSMSQSKIFDNGEKGKINELIQKIMEITYLDGLSDIGVDRGLEAEFIKGAFAFWKDELKVELIKIMEKLKKEWKHEGENL